VAAVRDPRRLFDWARAAGVPAPATWVGPDCPPAGAGGPFLRKPLRSGGGRGIRPWRPGDPARRGTLVQRCLAGTVVGAAALGDGRTARLLALSRGLAGDPALGARGYAYAGSLLGPMAQAVHEGAEVEASEPGSAQALVSTLAAAFGLRGLFGVDGLLVEGRLHLVEVNPRYTASMELIEAAWGAAGPSLVDLHAEALAGRLPSRLPPAWAPGRPVLGKGIVYAGRPVVVPETDRWLAAGWRDVPQAGTRIPAGAPVCTVLAAGPDHTTCLDALHRAADAVRRALRTW
jgi:predicted ATP-grasp superfamily ATP-dependent carboligase